MAKTLQDRFPTLSLESTSMDRPAVRRCNGGELGKWSRLVKELNIKAE